MAELSNIERSFDEMKNKSRVSTPNPWLDPKFNRIDPWGKEPGIKLDDIPERLGLMQEGQAIDLMGNDFIDLGDTPSNYGKNEQFVKTDGSGTLTFDWPYWIKIGSNIYYKKGNVGVGLARPVAKFHTFGDNILDGAVTINESGRDKDFRVEGSGATYTHLLFADASADMVGINEDAPKALLHARLSTCTDYAGVMPNTALLLEGSGNISLQLQGATDGTAYIVFADDDYNPSAGTIMYAFASDTMSFAVAATVSAELTASGFVCFMPLLAVDIAGASIPGIIQIDTNEADAYYELREDGDLKWAWGFDHNDSLIFKFGEGVPGTNTAFQISPGEGSIDLVRAADKGLTYLDTGAARRWMLRVASSTNVVELLNRASDGKVEIHANTSTAGAGGDTLVATFEDTIISLVTELDITGSFTTLFDLNPSSTATQKVIDLTPSASLVQGRTWDGVYIDVDALDPATGDHCDVHGFHFTALNFASTDYDAEVIGFVTRACAADDFCGFHATITEATQDVAQNAFMAFGGTVALSATAKYRGLYVDYDSLSRNAGAPIVEGVRIKLPANYASFGTSFAGYFEGDGRSVTLCDTTYALTTSGDMNLVGTIIGVTELTVSTFIRLSSNAEIRFHDNGNYVGFEAPALAADQIWVLPDADGALGEHMVTDGAGTLSWTTGAGTGDVSAAAVLAEHTLIRGNGGAKGVQDSGIDIDDADNITFPDGASINLQEDITFLGATTENQIKFPDNLADALSFMEGANAYVTFVSTNGSEAIHFLKKVGVGTNDPDGLEVDVAVTETAQARDNVRLGVSSGTPRIIFEDSGQTQWQIDNSAGVLRFFNPGAAKVQITTDPILFINDTTNAKMTQGLTINQGQNDDEILALKSPTDVAHGVTDYTETDTYGAISKHTATSGGADMWGFTGATVAIRLLGVSTVDNTDKDATATAPIHLQAAKKSGTAAGVIGADANILAVANWGFTRFIVDAEGDAHADGSHATYQDHDDIKLLGELEDVLSDKVSKLEMKKKDVYKKHKIVHVSEGVTEKGKPFFSRFVSTKKKNMLLYGAIRQLNERVEALEASL